jgi:uncharacterized membrane protein
MCTILLFFTIPLHAQDIKDTVLSFNGIDNYVDITNDIPLNINQFTIEFWAKPANNTKFKTVIGQGIKESNKGMTIGFLNDSRFTFGFYNNSLMTTGTYNDETWHHWACVYEKTGANTFSRKLYLDAILLTQDEKTESYTGTGGLSIGKNYWDTRYFDGLIDDVRIWNIARSIGDISSSKDSPLAGNETGLIAYWKFDDNTGTTASGINNIDGTIHGANWKERFHYSLDMSTTTKQLYPAESFDYPFQIINTGWDNDTYDLTVLNSNWNYEFKDPDTNTVVNSIAVNSDTTQDLLVTVTVPQTGIANGASDTVTIKTTSQNNNQYTQTQQVVSSIPTFDFYIVAFEIEKNVHPGKTTSYMFQINNQGQTKDTYQITASGGNWTYTVIDMAERKETTSISVGAGANALFSIDVEAPSSGITNNQVDYANIVVASQNVSTVNQQQAISTTVQTHAFDLLKLTNNTEGTLGQTCKYSFQIANTGPNEDTYQLSLTGEQKWPYEIKDKSNATIISAITLAPSQSKKFNVNVTIPTTGLTNGETDTVNMVAVSQDNSSVTKQVEIITTSPFYDVSIIPPTSFPIVVNGQTTHFFVEIKNTGMHLDKYEASVIDSGNWAYEIRDNKDSGPLTSLQIMGGSIDTFIVKATVPYDLPIGTTDYVTIKIDSLVSPLSTDTLQITTQIPTFDMSITQIPTQAIVAPSHTFNYSVHIKNKCIINDAYTITTSGGNWSYTLRNKTNTANLNTISVDGNLSETFILQVGLPDIGSLTNGQTDTVNIHATSMGNSRVSNA